MKCSIVALLGPRPGAGFCRLDDGHASPHEFVWWDGEVTTRVDGEEIILEEGRYRREMAPKGTA